MAEMYEIRKGVPVPAQVNRKIGLTYLLRKMAHLDSIVVPSDKRSSVYSCAAQAGIKVRTQGNPDGSVTVWRVIDGEGEDEDTLNDPVTPSDISAIYTPDGGLPSGRYTQPVPHGPMVWVNDVDEHGRPVNLHKKKTAEEKQTETKSIFDPANPNPLDDILS